MAKDSRTIVRGIELPEGSSTKTYVPGDEDALDEALTPAQVKHLTESGALSGDWAGKAKTPATLKSNRRTPRQQELAQAPPRPDIENEPAKPVVPKHK